MLARKAGPTWVAEQCEHTVEQQYRLSVQCCISGDHAAASLCGYAEHCILQRHQTFHCGDADACEQHISIVEVLVVAFNTHSDNVLRHTSWLSVFKPVYWSEISQKAVTLMTPYDLTPLQAKLASALQAQHYTLYTVLCGRR